MIQSAANWLSRDPLPSSEMYLGPNLYEYVWNNPLEFNDEFGLCPCPGRDAANRAVSDLNNLGTLTVAAGGTTALVGTVVDASVIGLPEGVTLQATGVAVAAVGGTAKGTAAIAGILLNHAPCF